MSTPDQIAVGSDEATAAPAKLTDDQMAHTLAQYLAAGWQQSAVGLAVRGHLPDTFVPEDAPGWAKITSMLATMGSDAPLMYAGSAAGGAIGAAAGSEVPVVGTAVGGLLGAGFGAFALPATLRSTMMQHYERGDVTGAKDFMDRTSKATWEAIKSGLVGAAFSGGGGVGGKVATDLATGPIVKSMA
jgi:hypothetical protein